MQRRLDADTGHLAVEEHGVVDHGLTVQSRTVGAAPFGGRRDHRAGLVADQRHAQSLGCQRTPRRPTAGDMRDLDIEPVGAQQRRQHRGQLRGRARHEDPALAGELVERHLRQVPQRTRHLAAEDRDSGQLSRAL